MFETVLKALLEGFGKSLEIFALTLLGALPLGLIISFGSMSKFAPLKVVTRAVVWVVRGTPLMLQLIIFFYGPGLIFGTNIWGIGSQGRFIAVIVAFVLNYACYFSEIYRGGIEGISRGQYEAGQVLGMNKSQVFFRIVLPQVVKRIIPPMSNEIITLVKDTSLARIIGVYEIIYFGEKFIKSDGIIWPLFFTGVFYLLFSGVLTLLFGYIEKKLNYYHN
ncbi:MAG: amino acid ABC transporter permease [Oscillospiraceae bacterium]|nr:amino acid ABC transporter permease [Oscillospiraceae bacterium]